MPLKLAPLFLIALFLAGHASADERLALASSAGDNLSAVTTVSDFTATPPTVQESIGNFATPLLRDLTLPAEDVWERIRNGFALPDIDNTLVREQEAWYANRPDYVERMVERSQRYLYHIVEEIEKRGMPMEIALLPMIESAYNPVAYSRSRASGIWQFIPSTGKTFGLQQNWWYDGRRDVVAATDAALDYLEKLYDMFGSWDLALASYNWGEGAVSRAIARNQANGLPTDYASLKLPNETRYYVPKLQAVKNIVANPQRFGLNLASIPNRPYFTVVTASQQMDVKLAAKLAEVPIEEFISLNPGFTRPVITKNGSRALLLPVDKADEFLANLENHDEPLVTWQVYKAKSGERFNKIAAKYGMSTARLKEINDLPARKKAAYPGQPLLVPLRSGTIVADFPNLKATQPDVPRSARRGGRLSHAVKSGDTLIGIAQRYGTSVAQIKQWNKLRGDHLKTGQRLAIRPTLMAQNRNTKRLR